MTSPALVVLAAGLGRRYGGAKQFDPIGPGGAPLMDFAVYDAWRAGFGEVVFVVGPGHAEDARASLPMRYGKGLAVAIATQRLDDLPSGHRVPQGRDRPWGTTQAVLAAGPHLRGPFAVLNADDFYGRPAIEAAAEFLRHGGAPGHHAVLGYRLQATVSPHGGVNRAVLEQGPDGALAGIVEVRDILPGEGGRFIGMAAAGRREIAGDALVSMNLWAFGPDAPASLTRAFSEFLDAHPGPTDECYLPDAVQRMIRAGEARVDVLPTDSRWCGVTYAADRPWVAAILEELTRRGEYPERLWG